MTLRTISEVGQFIVRNGWLISMDLVGVAMPGKYWRMSEESVAILVRAL
jgi:hypothetical protein